MEDLSQEKLTKEAKQFILNHHLHGTKREQRILIISLIRASRKRFKEPIAYLEDQIKHFFMELEEEDRDLLRRLLKKYLKDNEWKPEGSLSPAQQLRPFLTPMEEVNGK